MTNLTAADLAAMKARADAAAPAPWYVNHMGELRTPSPWNGQLLGTWANGTDGPEAEFIAHAREDVPALLVEVAALREDRDGYKEASETYRRSRDAADARTAALHRQVALADKAPHEPECRVYDMPENCYCWKAEYDAAKEAML